MHCTTSVNTDSTDDIGKFTNDHDSKHVGRHASGIDVDQSAFGRQHDPGRRIPHTSF